MSPTAGADHGRQFGPDQRLAEEVEAMFAAWFKSVIVQAALWTQACAPRAVVISCSD